MSGDPEQAFPSSSSGNGFCSEGEAPNSSCTGNLPVGDPVLGGPAIVKDTAAPPRKKSQRFVTDSEDSEMDSDASDCEHYLYHPLVDYHAGLHSSDSDDGKPKLSNAGEK